MSPHKQAFYACLRLHLGMKGTRACAWKREKGFDMRLATFISQSA